MKEKIEPKKGFNLRTHHRNSEGKVISKTPYSLHCSMDKEGKVERLYEQPIGSGLYYYEDGKMHEEKSKKGMEKAAKDAFKAKRKAELEAEFEKRMDAELKAIDKEKEESEQKNKKEEKPVGAPQPQEKK